MIRTRIADEVPKTWIFEYYCKLQERLHGQDIKIKSLFNPTERTPSMFIYFKDGQYKFNDYSSGKYGTAIDLVMQLLGVPESEAHSIILRDYLNSNNSFYTEITLNKVSKFQVSSYKTRAWNTLDAKFWTQFGIGSKLLELYAVKPLESYVMSKIIEDGSEETITIRSKNIYGYFKKNGELYKVYQPKNEDYKFINVSSYIQGSEQLLYLQPTLVICSSLKDVMSLISLNLDVEAVAPNSENSLLSKEVLSAYLFKYKRVVTLFDNDKAGDNAMKKYEELFGIPGIYLSLSKDLSDSIRDFGSSKTRKCLKPLIINS